METRCRREITILPSMCDGAGRLGIPDTFALFMDIAAEHANALGCGVYDMAEKGLYWLTVRTRVRFTRRPALMEKAVLTTWPEAPGRLRANRDYLLEGPGGILAAGKTEWAVLDQATGKLRSPGEVYGAGVVFPGETVWDEPFSRLTESEMEEFARYTVRSVDMDLGEHMNNVAYLRSLAGAFPGAEWEAMGIREAEIAFRTPCHEGDTLIWQRRRDEAGLALRAALEDGTTVVLARLS